MLLLKKKSSKREKIHGAWPYLKTVIDHDDAVASNTECVVLVWAQIKFVSPLWQKLKLESTPLERLSEQFRFKFPTSPGHVSNPALPECLLCQIPHSLGTHHCQIPEGCRGGEGGCHRFELNGAFYKRWTQSGVCTTITSSANAPRPIIQRNVFPDGHLNLPIRQLEREKDLNYFM